jgi:hypothetical protein
MVFIQPFLNFRAKLQEGSVWNIQDDTPQHPTLPLIHHENDYNDSYGDRNYPRWGRCQNVNDHVLVILVLHIELLKIVDRSKVEKS